MLSKLKKWGIYALVCLCICGGCFILGYMARGWSSPVITIGSGEIIERTNIIYRPVNIPSDGNCADVINRYNSLLSDYNIFLSAVPEAYSVTADKILFKLHTQKYALTYQVHEKNRLSITPTAYIRAAFAPSFSVYYGGGCFFTWSGFVGGALIDNQPSLTLSFGYTIILP